MLLDGENSESIWKGRRRRKQLSSLSLLTFISVGDYWRREKVCVCVYVSVFASEREGVWQDWENLEVVEDRRAIVCIHTRIYGRHRL